MTEQIEQTIQTVTQQILQVQIGDLVLTCARLRAEAQSYAERVRVLEAAAAAERSGSPDGARSADGPGNEADHG